MFKLINSCLQTNTSYFTVDRPTAKIEVITNTPISSIIECEVLGLNFEYKFPLNYEYSTDEGNVFGNTFLIDDKVANFIRLNPNNNYRFRLVLNGKVINNEQNLRFNPKIVANFNGLYYALLKEVSVLKQDLVAFRSSRGIRPDAKVAKGMVPIATGNGTEYTWDFIYGDVADKLEKYAKLVSDLVESNNNLSSRLLKIEKDLTNHLYKNYDI